jgi:hypothetical protein
MRGGATSDLSDLSLVTEFGLSFNAVVTRESVRLTQAEQLTSRELI